MQRSILKLIVLFLPAVAGAQSKQAVTVDTLPPLNKGYSQAIIAGGRTLFIAGQVPVDSGGKIVGKGDFSAQVEQVLKTWMPY